MASAGKCVLDEGASVTLVLLAPGGCCRWISVWYPG